MGKSWFSAVKKALSPEPKEKKQQKPRKSKKTWFGKTKNPEAATHPQESPLCTTVGVSVPQQQAVIPHIPSLETVKPTDPNDEQGRHAYSVAIASAVAVEAAVAAAQAAAEVVRLTTSSHFSGKSKEEIAAIKIQTAFRGHMARRALRALRGLVRLKTLIQGHSVKRQAVSTLQCMQTLARVQYQIRERRFKLSEENQTRLKQLQQKHGKEFEKGGEDWDLSILSKGQIEASQLSKQEALMRRERALAYSFTHQQSWKKSSRFGHQTFMDPSNPNWGWSWLERWMAAARPPTATSLSNTPDNNDKNSVKSSASRAMSEITPRNKGFSPRTRVPSPRGKATKSSSPGVVPNGDDDSKSNISIKSEQVWRRRHSIGGSISSVRDKDDNESLNSSCSQSVPSYMAPTQAAKARARFSSPSPLGFERSNGNVPEKGSFGTVAKKRLSFSGSPRAIRRHSGPPKVESIAIKDIGVV